MLDGDDDTMEPRFEAKGDVDAEVVGVRVGEASKGLGVYNAPGEVGLVDNDVVVEPPENLLPRPPIDMVGLVVSNCQRSYTCRGAPCGCCGYCWYG
jgi:hypothetical protein